MPKRYKFSLEKLLELRIDKEEESKRLFSESQNALLKSQEELAKMQQDFAHYNGIKPGETVIYQKVKRNYLFALENGIKKKKKEVNIKKQELELRRQDLNQKRIDRKTVATLKEKQYNAYIKELDRVEQNTIDEIALYSYMRNLKGGE